MQSAFDGAVLFKVALAIEAAFLILARNIGPGFLVDIAYTVPVLAFSMFGVVFSIAKISKNNAR